MPFTSINSTNPRTNPWNFWKKKYWELAILKNSVFLSQPFRFFFASFPWKSVLDIKNGSKFGWLPWFPAKITPPKHFSPQCILYITLGQPMLKTNTKYSWKFLMPNGSPILKSHKQHYPIRYQSRVYLTSQVPKWVFYGVLVCINPKLYVLICMGSSCKKYKMV